MRGGCDREKLELEDRKQDTVEGGAGGSCYL